MRDCISVSGRWFYGLFEEIVDLFTIKSTGNPKLTSSALGAFILIDDWLVGRLNDGTLCRLWSLFGLKIFFHYIPIVFCYGGFGITLTVDLFINIFFVKYNHSMVHERNIIRNRCICNCNYYFYFDKRIGNNPSFALIEFFSWVLLIFLFLERLKIFKRMLDSRF